MPCNVAAFSYYRWTFHLPQFSCTWLISSYCNRRFVSAQQRSAASHSGSFCLFLIAFIKMRNAYILVPFQILFYEMKKYPHSNFSSKFFTLEYHPYLRYSLRCSLQWLHVLLENFFFFFLWYLDNRVVVTQTMVWDWYWHQFCHNPSCIL